MNLRSSENPKTLEGNMSQAEKQSAFISKIAHTMVAQCIQKGKDPINTIGDLQSKISASQTRRRFGKKPEPLTTFMDTGQVKLFKDAFHNAHMSAKREGSPKFSLQAINRASFGQDFSLSIGEAIKAYYDRSR